MIKKNIVHILNKEDKNLLLADRITREPEIEKLVTNDFKKVFNSIYLREVEINNKDAKELFEILKNDEDKFIETTKAITTFLYGSVKKVKYDIVFSKLLYNKTEEYTVILFKDYQEVLNTDVDRLGNEMNIKVLKNEMALRKNIKLALIVGENKTYFLDIDAEKGKNDSVIAECLKLSYFYCDRYYTRKFEKVAIEISNKLANKKLADTFRVIALNLLNEIEKIKIDEFINKSRAYLDDEEIESLKIRLEDVKDFYSYKNDKIRTLKINKDIEIKLKLDKDMLFSKENIVIEQQENGKYKLTIKDIEKIIS